MRRPRYALAEADPAYFAKAVEDELDFVKRGMQSQSPFGETTFSAAMSRLAPGLARSLALAPPCGKNVAASPW